MVQASIFVRSAQLSDAKYVSDATKVINDAYGASNCWAPGANVITEPRCKEEEILDLIQNSGNPNTLLLAFDESNVVGTVLIKPIDNSTNEGELTLFSVCPKYQSRGIGGKLIRQALEEMTKLEFKIVSLVVLDHRLELITWYKRFGFTEFDRYPFVWLSAVKVQNIQALVLKKLLIR
jgi:predicted N-acetyltransferase YhbS